jgi:autotransporter-associated beta strand protein
MQLASTGFVSSTVTIFGGTFDTANQNRSITTLTLGGGGAGSAAGLQTGSGTVTLAGNVTFTATNNPDGATIGGNLSLGGATRTVTVNDSTAAVADLTISAVISQVSTAGLTKSGSGTLALTGQNTFTGKVAVNEGTVQIDSVVASTGVASPLGRNSTIDLGTAWRSGTLRWMGASSGSTNLVLNLSGTSGGGSIDAGGGGALTISGGVTSSNTTAKVFTLTGTSTALNTIGVVSGTNLSVVKDGPGRWRLTGTSSFDGTFTVKNGTLVAAANSGETGSGVFGTQNPVVGDTTPGATGTAALLVEAGYSIQRDVTVASGVGVSQSVLLGGASESGTVTFASGKNLNIGRDVALVARPGGTVTFSNNWTASSGTGTPTANVAIGADGYTGAVRLLTSGTLATGGSIGVRYGTAVLGSTTILDGAGTLAIDAGATLAGIGTVAGPLGGAGLVAPGNSPGILTAEAVDPSQGLAWAFEFTGSSPDYTNPAASVNDVLRLTGTAPFTAGLTSGNVVGIYLSGSATGNVGDVYTGGFFSDSDVGAFAAFQSLVSSGSYVAYYQSGTGSYTYNGQNYALLSDLGRQLQVGVATGQSATFSGTTSTVTIGQVTTFTVVVPEPATITLAALGVAIAAWTLRRRRPG